MLLKNKTAVITGASAGIGREAALLFAEHGAAIALADVNDAQGEKTAKELKSKGAKAFYIHTDVSKEADCKAMIAQAEKEFGKVDVVFNNAGIMHPDDGDETSEEIWDKTLAINVKGVFFGCKHALESMKKNGGGSIINTASFVAVMGAATPQIAYTASKGAVLAMTRELAVVNAKKNIRVNALCPGPLKTKLLMDFLDTDEKKNRRLVHLPMGRFGEASEMAKAALFLASDLSSYVTGENLMADGGLSNAYVTAE